MRVLWEGPFFRPLSLDKVNRELVTEGLRNGNEMLIHATDQLSEASPYDALAHLHTGFQPVSAHVRHMWPPYWDNRSGPLVLCQAWEYGAVPDDWIHPIQTKAEKLVVYSQAVEEMFVESGIEKSRVSVIPLGVNRAIFQPSGPKMNIPGVRSHVILWVGGLIPRKGLDILLNAYQLAFHKHDDVTLVVKTVGQGSVYQDTEVPRLLQKMLEDPVSAPIIVLDQDFTEAEMAALYRRANLLVSPYRGEGFNLPVLEAMACGTLVAASDTNPTNEFLPEDIGWRIPGGRRSFAVAHSTKRGWEFTCDSDSLASIMQNVVTLSPDDIRRRKSLAQDHVQHHYTWPIIWKKWEEILTSIESPAKRLTRVPPKNAIIWRGPIRTSSGYASEARMFLSRLPQVGVVPRIVDESGNAPSVASPTEEKLWSALEKIAVDPETLMIHHVAAYSAYKRWQGTDLVRTMFETDRLPNAWHAPLNAMDGIIVASPFNRQTFADSGIAAEKIHVVPSPIDVQLYHPDPSRRSQDMFRFISVLDWSPRQGWDLLIRAWAIAFTARDPVTLIIKLTNLLSSNPESEAAQLIQSMGFQLSDIAPISLVNEHWPQNLMPAFYQSAHAFVLPTRGEGWGRPILEAMACGLPVIATQWSAPAFYLTNRNSFPIEVKHLSPIPSDYPVPLYRGHQWAEPDLDHLVHQLHTCFTHGTSGLESIRETALQYSPENATNELVSVLARYGIAQVNVPAKT